jgi:Big-like domain-containing protein
VARVSSCTGGVKPHTAQQQVHGIISGTPLVIVSVTPPNDVKDVEPNTAVTATFSNDLDPASIKGTDHFTLVRIDTAGTAHTPVSGDVDYGQPGNPPRVGAFRPAAHPENGRTYQATITEGVMDLRGNTLAEDYAWQFSVKP